MAHALLSASSASRWLACPPSARLTENMSQKVSVAAEEGTLAHYLAEYKVYEALGMPHNICIESILADKYYSAEMDFYTDEYCGYVSEIIHNYSVAPYVAVEQKVDFSDYVPEGFGTSDCIIIAEGCMHIIDLKYGKGVLVEVKGNPQAKLYALGAYGAFKNCYDITEITVHIHQPRISNVVSAHISVKDLLAWGEAIKPIARLAFDGGGELVAGEKQCRFCLAKGRCKTLAKGYSDLALREKPNAALMTLDEVGEVIKLGEGLESWLKTLKEHLLHELLEGKICSSHKVVEGRGSRAFKDIDATFAHLLANGVSEAMLYDRVPLTAPKLERLLGVKKFAQLTHGQVVKKRGKPTLADVSDGRADYNSAADVFKNVIKNINRGEE